jgi:hypothetical protein
MTLGQAVPDGGGRFIKSFMEKLGKIQRLIARFPGNSFYRFARGDQLPQSPATPRFDQEFL